MSETMRELTPSEQLIWYRAGCWPCCRSTGYLAGPRGGLMQNIKCPRCGTEMNVVDPEDRRFWGDSLLPGQMLREPDGYASPPFPLDRRWRLWLMWRRVRDFWGLLR